MKIIQQGAEATIYLDKNKIVKQRNSKSYRSQILDKKIIKTRTKSETNILKKASKIISVPVPEESKKENEIIMSYINGKKLSQELDKFSLSEQKQIMKLVGKSISKLHKEGIIHGDLTTSNMIYKDKKIYFIDFGLGFQNGKYEDKGVDIHLLKQALEAKHFKNWETLFNEFKKAYSELNPQEAKKVFEKLNSIEKRGRYRS